MMLGPQDQPRRSILAHRAASGWEMG